MKKLLRFSLRKIIFNGKLKIFFQNENDLFITAYTNINFSLIESIYQDHLPQ